MSYTGINVNGGVTYCYPFYERLITCAKTESLPVKMCTPYGEDFYECLNRKKQHALNYKMSQELHKYKILALPRYDEENDRFVVDYTVPNADEFFAEKQ